MMKETYVKPVMKPTEPDSATLREEYLSPDMEVVDLGTATVIATEPPVPQFTLTPWDPGDPGDPGGPDIPKTYVVTANLSFVRPTSGTGTTTTTAHNTPSRTIKL